MTTTAEKRVITYVDVTIKGDCRDFRVFENGVVTVWDVGDENVKGYWKTYDDYEDNYEAIKQAGLEVLK